MDQLLVNNLLAALKRMPTKGTTGPAPLFTAQDPDAKTTGTSGGLLGMGGLDLASLARGGSSSPRGNTGGSGGPFTPMTSVIPRFDEGGSGAPGTPSPGAFGSAPSISNDSPISFAGMLNSAITGPNATPSPLGTTAINLGLNAASFLTGIPTSVITLPTLALGLISQLAQRAGLVGQDTSGLVSEGQLSGMNQGGPISNDTFSTLTQGLGLTNAQLNAITENAPFDTAPPAPDPTFSEPNGEVSSDPSDPGEGTGEGEGEGTGEGTGSDSSEDQGGYIGRKPRKLIDMKGHVKIKALKTEFITNPKATKMFRPMLEMMNEMGKR